MDYFDILKKAWKITWRYKALWVLGLFAGAGSGGSTGGSSNYSSSTGDTSQVGQQFDEVYRGFMDFVSENVVLVAVVVGLLVVIGLVFWVLSIAAQGGLIHGANEAAEDRTPSLRESWGVGFARWGRTFMIGLVLGLPVIIVGAIMAALLVAAGIGGFASGSDAGAGMAVGSVCLLLPILVVAIVAVSLIIGILYQLALRYGVLDDMTFGEAIKRGWSDLWAKKGAWIFWLVMLLPGIAYGVVTLVVLLPFLVSAFVLVMKEQYIIAGGLFLLMILVLMIPGAIYGTFISSAWTVFFRRMTGREPGGAQRAVPAAPYDPYAAPPAPPTAPPVAPAPMPAQVASETWSAPAEAPIVDVPPAPPLAVPEDAPIVDAALPSEPPADV